jgi:hypothetical protein
VSKLVHTFRGECARLSTHSAANSKFGRVPVSVVSDLEVSDYDARVYFALSALERKGFVSSGVRQIAKISRKSFSGAAKALKRLILRGHVEKVPGKRGQRGAYRLTSVVFGGAVAVPTLPIEQPAPRKTMIQCGGCTRKCARVGATGLCRQCVENIELPRKIVAAQAELGATATAEQIAVHLKMRRFANRIRRIIAA